MGAKKLKESDLFEPVKEWLGDEGYEVYAEVQLTHGAERVDVVGVKGDEVVAVEMKTSFSLELLNQAYKHKYAGIANKVYVAVPRPKTKHFNEYGIECLRREGIGLLEIDDILRCDRHYHLPDARQDEMQNTWLVDALTERHKDQIGGTNGAHLTRYKITMLNIKDHLTATGRWHTAKSILEEVDTHYKPSQRKRLEDALTAKVPPQEWCEWRTEDGVLLFRAKQLEPAGA